MRKAVFWVHLIAGLLVSSVVFVMAVTGLMLAFEPQIIAAIERGAGPGASRMAPSAIIAKVREASPEAAPVGITLRRDRKAPAAVSLGRSRTLFVDPYTGKILGEGSRVRAFLRQVEQLHRNLCLGETGKRITGASTLAFVALTVTGLYLWIPRRWAKAIVLPSMRLRGKARDFNWHYSVGLLAALPLLVIALTGIVMNYEWANRLLFRLAGSEPPPSSREAGGRTRPERREGAQPPIDFGRIDELWTAIEATHEKWQAISVRAQGPSASANVMVDWGNGSRPDQRVMLTADLSTGKITKVEPYESNAPGRRARLWMRPIHTGGVGGVSGQALAALAASAAGLLVWTGIALAWRRFRMKPSAPDLPRFPSADATATVVPVAAAE